MAAPVPRCRRRPTAGSLLAVVLAIGIGAAPAGIEASPRVHRALVVSVDGLRPDVLLRARAPVVHRLMTAGSFTMWAQTTKLAITLPSHASMLTGMTPAGHRVLWNGDLPLGQQLWPARPTVFELAKRAGLTTAMAAAKSKFSTLARPGTLDWCAVPARGTQITDEAVTDTAVAWIERHAPEVLFVHLAAVDAAGHETGWGSARQIAAFEADDRCIGRLLDALRRRRLLDSTVVLVTADHGGAGRTHGPGDPRSRTIPWILCGPGIRADFDLTIRGGSDVRIEDTFATLCDLLGLPIPGAVDGHPIRLAYEPQQSAAR